MIIEGLDIMTRDEAAKYIGKSVETLDRWIKSGLVPAYRLGPKTILVRKSDLDKLLRPIMEVP
jgi:excisionase family DNA binding protein